MTVLVGLDRETSKVVDSPSLRRANRLAGRGEVAAAREEYRGLLASVSEPGLRGVVLNNLAALEAAKGRFFEAGELFGEAVACRSVAAGRNLGEIQERVWKRERRSENVTAASAVRARPTLPLAPSLGREGEEKGGIGGLTPPRSPRIAIVSFLFNWPSTGGGTVHTKELADFLTRAGYAVRHLFVRYGPWQIGQVGEPLPYDHQPLEFSERDWSPEIVRDRVRGALREFSPDQVILTDSWNSKVLLAEAAAATDPAAHSGNVD